MKTLLVTLLKTVARPAFRLPCALGLTLLALAPSAWATTSLTNTSTTTWTCPAGVTSVTVECWGGGGAGGSAQRTSGSGQCAGGGGAGGAYAKKVVSVSNPNTYTVTVGAGGVILSSAADGTSVAGGDSWFSTSSTVFAKGGAGGVTKVGVGGAAGAGGVGSTTSCIGDVLNAGGNGSTPTSGSAGGGGGGSGGSGSAGTSLGNNVPTGAAAVTGGGPGGNGATVNGGGSAPVSGPGGGGGGARGPASAQAGGAGFAGQVVLTYASAPVVTTPTATAITDTTATLGANVTDNGGSALTSRGTVWDTTSAPTANLLAEGGTGTGIFTQPRTGLPAGTQIFYRGFAVNAVGTSYSADGSFYTLAAPATTASSALNFTSVGQTSMTVNWTSGNGGHRIVIAKASSAPSGTPANATVYSASATYGSGAALAGGFVVYDGTGSSVTVSGLTASTPYYFVVYEYTEVGSTVATVNYLTSSSLAGNQSSAAATTPTIIVVGNPVTLAFGSLGINSTSANQSYSVSGLNLTADISITAPSGYQISTSSGSGFVSSLTLTQASGTVASTNIYVRFAPTAVTAYSGNVVNSSASATTINVAVTGTGAAIAPTVTSTAADGITTNAGTLHGSIVSDGGATITDRGFVYGNASGITIASNKVSGSASFTTTGNYQWVCPAGVTSVQVECWGGGGAGGWATRGPNNLSCGGGAGGAYAKLNSFSVTAGNTYYVNVGAGGVSVVTDLATVPGGDSWFNSANTPSATIIAKGGAGGVSLNSTNSGSTATSSAGGTGTTIGSAGDVLFAGGSGATSVTATSGGGGGSGGTGSAGNVGVVSTTVGAAAVTGGGNGALSVGGTSAGLTPTLPPGGGGSGGRAATAATNSFGGSGAAGQVVLTYSGPGAVPMDYTVGLSPNVVTYWKAYAVNSVGTTLSSERSFYTLANVPTVPTVNGATTNSLNVRVNVNGNPATTEFAIQETNSLNYVQANGTLGGPTVWQTTNVWHAVTNFVTVTGLIPGSNYVFQVKARNGDNTETAFSPAAGNTVTKATTTITGVTASQSISYGTATVTLSGTVSAGTLFPADGETVSVIINATTNPATISGGAGGFSVNYPTATILPSLTPYTITYAYGGSATLKTSSDATTALTVNGIKVPALAYTNGQGISRQITLSEIQSAGLFSPQPSPTYTITLPSASSTGGGSVITNGAGTIILYTPPSGSPASDTFSYTVSDGVALGTNTVTITFQLQASGSNPQISVSGSPAVINGTLYGIPTVQYDIQRKTNLSDTVWQTLSSPPLSNAPPYTADLSSGKISFTDTNPPPSSGYYRTIQH